MRLIEEGAHEPHFLLRRVLVLGGDEQAGVALRRVGARRVSKHRFAGRLRAVDVGKLLGRDGVDLGGRFGGGEPQLRLRLPVEGEGGKQRRRRALDDAGRIERAAGRLDDAIVEQR
ncbi:MAG: hypothetical protein WDN31_19925 [Hyphomicrobium sp.]